MQGAYLPAHRDEILALVRNQEREENTSHVLHRIMSIEDGPAAIVIKTTDIHLPRRIGEALHRAFKGQLERRYDKAGCFLRVNWSRAA